MPALVVTPVQEVYCEAISWKHFRSDYICGTSNACDAMRDRREDVSSTSPSRIVAHFDFLGIALKHFRSTGVSRVQQDGHRVPCTMYWSIVRDHLRGEDQLLHDTMMNLCLRDQDLEGHGRSWDQAVTTSISAKNSLDTAARLDVYLRVTQVLVRARKACRLPRLQLGSILGEEARSIISDLKADMQNLRSGKAARVSGSRRRAQAKIHREKLRRILSKRPEYGPENTSVGDKVHMNRDCRSTAQSSRRRCPVAPPPHLNAASPAHRIGDITRGTQAGMKAECSHSRDAWKQLKAALSELGDATQEAIKAITTP